MIDTLANNQAKECHLPGQAMDEPGADLALLAQEWVTNSPPTLAPASTNDLLERVAHITTTLRQAHRHFLGSAAEPLTAPLCGRVVVG
jgi:hypothetical protein